MANTIKVKVNEKMATLTLARPKVHNAFNDEMIEEIITALDELAKNEALHVLVIEAEGKSFCAGADLNWMSSMRNYTFEENVADSLRLHKMLERIEKFPTPVLAAVNGAAMGGGVGLVAACDYVLACEEARFAFSEVRLGLVPAVISPFVFRKMNPSFVKSHFVTADRFDAKVAMGAGLVHQVSLTRHFRKDVDDRTEKFFNLAPKALRESKRLAREVMEQLSGDRKELTSYTTETISKLRIGNEGQEGMRALLEKRKPNWVK